MIVDTIQNRSKYDGVHENVKKALVFLESAQQMKPAIGRHEIEGDEVYALVQEYDTTPPEEKKFEAHREYIDVQFVDSGIEHLYWQNADESAVETEYDSEQDCLFYRDAEPMPIRLAAGYFVVLFPHDAHKPGCAVDVPRRVRKIVVKCRVR